MQDIGKPSFATGMVSGGIEKYQWHEMGQSDKNQKKQSLMFKYLSLSEEFIKS